MLLFGGVYALFAVLVAASLQPELEAKPKATAAVILLYPLIPAALVELVARFIP